MRTPAQSPQHQAAAQQRTDKAVPRKTGLKVKKQHRLKPGKGAKGRLPVYGALDLGTNNCRLLLARPNRHGFQVVDAFSRIIRLGEGMSETGNLSPPAMDRTIEALNICADKMRFHRTSRTRLVATEACRAALNAGDFINRVKRRTGLELEIINQQTEATLAVTGCVTLIDESYDHILIFDIGGGSTELIWLDVARLKQGGESHYLGPEQAITDWISLPVGVVTLAEKFDGREVNEQKFRAMVSHVKERFGSFAANIARLIEDGAAKVHYLGTSGTVTTLAGVYLAQETYDRQQIDGLWMDIGDIRAISERLMGLSLRERQAIPTIGPERADLVLGGCAILEAMLEIWPTEKLRVADRGLREGILATLMAEDGYIQKHQCWVSSPKRMRRGARKYQRPRRRR